MAKVKNIGRQPRGFYSDDGTQVVVRPGEEKEFNMSEADYNKAKELVESEEYPSLEISGEHGGVKKLSIKEQREADAKKAEEAAQKQAEAAQQDQNQRDPSKKRG
jgi:transposase